MFSVIRCCVVFVFLGNYEFFKEVFLFYCDRVILIVLKVFGLVWVEFIELVYYFENLGFLFIFLNYL